MSDADDVTCARFALGEFAVRPRSLHDGHPPELLAGRYEVGRLVGSGGTARVYRAYDVRLAREVAVKIYDRDAVALDQRRRLREMSIQGSITHPGVVALLDSGTEHGRTYLVMQLVEGENLAERLLGGPMPVAEVTALADGLAEALAHVHARRVVHRDLKPANVFLSVDGPLIGDFGIAHALDTTHITGTGVVPGTAAYLAPEQVGGERAGPPADVYALGLILLECVTGRREYPGTMVEAAMARLTRPPRIPEGLPPSLAHTLRRMTQREPADRPTAAEVRQLLHAPAPTLPRATERRGLAAAAVLRRWHRAAPDRGLRGTAGRRRTVADDGGKLGHHGPHAPAAAGPGRPGGLDPAADGAGESGHRYPIDSPAGHRGPLAPTVRDTGVAHRPGPAGPRRILAAVGLSADGDPARRRRFTAAAGLTAAAVAAASALFLAAQEPGTSTPAQPPAPSSPASSRPSPAPLAGTGTPDAGPGAAESADLEPAAVTRESQATPKATKPVKPPKPEPHGKGKGKGPGHD
ncbi:serine/threonine-protein kinase [Amycolatopsis mongoliensis]|uniref:non-specific serine/threonine protein kinase n=1 Tax=Amycolatopsis mongoliensis TaxID=715475 RepID=A0A9Y2JQ02_9PSEU|nr:serine/threonine-protein kinase [Amycolatopsis sp. 4-36]WIY01389.1 serine/threonine-protein kinase [Amycolatopsis sp. 4-36]